MKILSIDDNPQNRTLIEKALAGQFEVISNDGNTPILQLMTEHQPSIVLMDIMLEGKSGFDLVKEIKEDGSYPELEIIFISALTSSEDKLKAYACGGDDYIAKPVDFAELKEKLRRVESRIEEKRALKDQFQMASSTAFTSMQQASELGQLVNFFTESLNVSDLPSLYSRIREFCINAGVTCCVEFRLAKQQMQYPIASTTNLEKEILELGRTAKRIAPFGANMLFSSPQCSILVKGLPISNEELLGRMRDNLAILLTIVDSRVNFIEGEMTKDTIRKKAVADLKQQLEGDFGTIKALCEDQDKQISSLVNNLSQAIQLKIITLGLDEEQESALVGLVDETREYVEEAMGLSFIIEEKLQGITQRLTEIE